VSDAFREFDWGDLSIKESSTLMGARENKYSERTGQKYAGGDERWGTKLHEWGKFLS